MTAGKQLVQAVLVFGIAAAIAAGIWLAFREYGRSTPAELHVLVPEGRRIKLRAGSQEATGTMHHLVLEVARGRQQVELLEDGKEPRRFDVDVSSYSRVLLPVDKQCFAFYPRESNIALRTVTIDTPLPLEADVVFEESERPSLPRGQTPGTPGYETAKGSWLLVKPTRCGQPTR